MRGLLTEGYAGPRHLLRVKKGVRRRLAEPERNNYVLRRRVLTQFINTLTTMGSATSRPLQKLPKTLSNRSHNQQKPPSSIPKLGTSPIGLFRHPQACFNSDNLPSSTRTPAPNPSDDLPNPNLLSNLAQLGQVRVQNPAVDIPVSPVRRHRLNFTIIILPLSLSSLSL